MDLDCGLVHGDGSRPAVLSELGPGNTDFLFCMTESDQDNILAALAGKSLGFDRVVAMIEDPDFSGLCAELGLEDVLIPSQETANAVTDRVAGIESVDLAPLMKTGIRFFSFAARKRDEGTVADLELPDWREGPGRHARGRRPSWPTTRPRSVNTTRCTSSASRSQVKKLRERFIDD